MSKMPAGQQQATLAAMGNAQVTTGNAQVTTGNAQEYMQLRQSLRDAAVVIGLGNTVPNLLSDKLPETITDEVKNAVDTFGDPENDYESAVVAVEIWR
jgi:hypothetical protein